MCYITGKARSYRKACGFCKVFGLLGVDGHRFKQVANQLHEGRRSGTDCLEKQRPNLVLFTVVALKGFALSPLPQDDEFIVSLDPIAKTERISITDLCGQGAFDVPVRGWRFALFCKDVSFLGVKILRDDILDFEAWVQHQCWLGQTLFDNVLGGDR